MVRHDECKHAGVGKFTDVACGKVVFRKKVCTEEKLDSLLHYIIWDPGIDLVELFFGGIYASCGIEVVTSGRSPA